MTVGERIQEAREKAGLTQSELAEKLGVAAITVGQYERDKRQPRLGQLQAIAKVLNADIIYLISGQPSTEVESGILIDAELEARNKLQKLQLKTANKPFEERLALSKSVMDMIDLFGNLNRLGQQRAVEHVEELTYIPHYCAETTPDPPPAPSEGTDTIPSSDGSEGPQEDK